MQEYTISSTITVQTHENIVACIGYFDGFHLGHQSLFNKTLSEAASTSQLSALISFEPDPWTVLKKQTHIQHLTTLKDRKQLAEAMGFDIYITLQFNEEMATMDPLRFIDKLKYSGIRTLICGFDFRFGHQGLGTIDTLKAAESDDFKVFVIEEKDYLHEKISTTRIKIALEQGQMELAQHLLGRTYGLKGIVVHGQQIGRKIGYPTANLKVDDEYILPKVGVYAGYVSLHGLMYTAMIGLGYNPTVKDDRIVSIEAHLFDFDQDIYDEEVDFLFVHYLRNELKFDGLEGLIEQLKIDELQCRELAKNPIHFSGL